MTKDGQKTLNEEQIENAAKTAQRGELNASQTAALIKSSPEIVTSLAESVKEISSAASEGVRGTQHALMGIKSAEAFAPILMKLAENCEGDEARVALAKEVNQAITTICNSALEAQREGNSLVRFLGKAFCAVLCIVALGSNGKAEKPS